MLGLFAFFYVCGTFVFVSFPWTNFLNSRRLIGDVVEKTVYHCWICGICFITSACQQPRQIKWCRYLQHRWNQLHRLVYLAAMVAVLHFWWMVKIDTREPAIYAVYSRSTCLGLRVYFLSENKDYKGLISYLFY